jgi:Holliday junction resolvasome RuvABC ATP-dependent DNA helicase subunit
MIGMKKVKDNIVDQIVYFLSGIEENSNMLHTVITGSPGVGKTALGRIIGEIYYHMGVLKGTGKKYVDPQTGI